MKTNRLTLIILLLLSIYTFSQPHFREKREQIKALKIAFITNELALTPDEATKFWPIYNAFDDKQNEIRFNRMRAFKDKMDDDAIDKLNEKEAALLLTQTQNNEEDLYQNQKNLINNLKGVISSKKILRLKKAEEDFKRKLLQQYRDKGQMR